MCRCTPMNPAEFCGLGECRDGGTWPRENFHAIVRELRNARDLEQKARETLDAAHDAVQQAAKYREQIRERRARLERELDAYVEAGVF
jgi:hypothetical protein